MNSPIEQQLLDCLHNLVFTILLKTDGRTTDILETVMEEKMEVRVLRQEQLNDEKMTLLGEPDGTPYYIRESILVSDRSRYIVSHNIALVSSSYVPAPLFEAIASRRKGIGTAISSLGLQSSRQISDYGWRREEEVVDLFRNPLKLRFPNLSEPAPFKRYSILFDSAPGIHLLEYFNPNMIRHRVKQRLGWPS